MIIRIKNLLMKSKTTIFLLLIIVSLLAVLKLNNNTIFEHKIRISKLSEEVELKQREIEEQIRVAKITEDLLVKYFKDTREYNELQQVKKLTMIEDYIKSAKTNRDDKNEEKIPTIEDLEHFDLIINGMHDAYQAAKNPNTTKGVNDGL